MQFIYIPNPITNSDAGAVRTSELVPVQIRDSCRIGCVSTALKSGPWYTVMERVNEYRVVFAWL